MTMQDRAAVLAFFRDQAVAMTAGDTRALDALLADDFTLTHMTGYTQLKDEWLTEMRAGQFDYHRIEEQHVTVDVEGDTSVLSARTFTEATVYGSRTTWRLVLTQHYRRIDGRWTTNCALATTW